MAESRRVVVVGASAGGVEALKSLVSKLPHDFPAPLLAVLHVSPDAPSFLPKILEKAGRLPASHAHDGEKLQAGRIYIAPPDQHLLIEDSAVRVTRGPQENRNRPAIDPLFRSAAVAYGSSAIGVLLSGLLDDGTAGLVAIKVAGGTAIVQDPNDAMYPSMPKSALRYVQVDEVLPVADIPALLTKLARAPTEATRPREKTKLRRRDQKETKLAEFSMEEIENDDRPGTPSGFSCPDCHGSLWEIRDNDMVRFRCRVGHAFSSESMIAAHDDSVERALWAALRALEERAALARRIAEGAKGRELTALAGMYRERVEQAERDATLIRDILKTPSRV